MIMWEKACPAVVWEGTERERVWREEKKKRYYWGVAGLFFLKLFKLNKIFDSIFSHIRLPDTNNKYIYIINQTTTTLKTALVRNFNKWN